MAGASPAPVHGRCDRDATLSEVTACASGTSARRGGCAPARVVRALELALAGAGRLDRGWMQRRTDAPGGLPRETLQLLSDPSEIVVAPRYLGSRSPKEVGDQHENPNGTRGKLDGHGRANG